MPRLVLVNGPPAVGKSTLARRYAGDRPLTLALDVDVLRSMLGQWLVAPTEAGLLARAMALAMARVHLAGGRDVIVPQFLARLDFVLELQALADDVGAAFVEVVLLGAVEDVAARFAARTLAAAALTDRTADLDAAALLERSGGLAALPGMHAQLLDLVASRPRTVVVPVVEGEVDRAYLDLVAAIGE